MALKTVICVLTVFAFAHSRVVERDSKSGCRNPMSTCKDTKHGSCPDGVSPADDEHNSGCPMPKCEETLYGCCTSDNKTAAEGNDQEGCPPPCKASRYGCCAENDTQATGPHKEGCPETATSTTESTESTTDSTADTGSTETGSTETTTEGTTELTTVGVCSNVNGCECKSSPFGCCPDNKTYARGASFSGCGCEHTPYGCCLDRHTEAIGPEFEGCSCHTYQFGCCPDGETAAEGPNHQGCLCHDTTAHEEHGCCSDDITAATGPDQEGYDCASSPFGCCPDGVTMSQSKNFTGCADAPVNRQAVCVLPYEAGSCTNYTVQWYYDLQYGGCSRFHYSGCEGNGNRFADKAECEDVCVHPTAKVSLSPAEDEKPYLKVNTQTNFFNIGETKPIYCEGYHLSREPEWYNPAGEKIPQKSPKTNRIFVESRPVPAQGTSFTPLIFKNLLPEDSGIYTCKAGDLNASITIFVVEKAVMEEEEQNYDVEARHSIELSCVAKGTPTPEIHWYYKDNNVEPIVTNLKYTITYEPKASTSILKIDDLNPMDPLTYRCRATQESISHFAEKIYRLRVQRKLLM